MKTIFVNEKDAQRNWYIIDAAGKPMGRVAAKVAVVLRGKNKATFAPNQEMGDFVVIVNADKVAVTGAKATDKMYYHHTGYVGGLKSFTFEKKIERHPEAPLMLAIKGMLPNGRLGRKLLKNVKVYAGENHPHAAQNPQPLEI
ncbi:MAG: 50S ribosomal protein L13 [Spirochaetaceae bacterium]|nr:50S ribosomal protein L13 [Spirochaetaceae bacterium]MBO5236507.1 50S ribosomal protein L13 [Spirochaetaceae bacterium]